MVKVFNIVNEAIKNFIRIMQSMDTRSILFSYNGHYRVYDSVINDLSEHEG